MSTVDITILPSSSSIPTARSLPITLSLPPASSIRVLKLALASHFPRLIPVRQRLTLDGEKKPLEDEDTLDSVGLGKGGKVRVKDLGPQIGWRTVFVIEYLGPLLIHPVFYHFQSIIYRYASPFEHSDLQRTVYILTMLHFLKRELETLFLHSFSRSTMPFAYVYRNSAHYWLLSGLLIALVLYSPSYGQDALLERSDPALSPTWIWSWVGLWIFAQLSNFHTHYTVAHLRPPGSKKHYIPRGYGFALVSFPNYFFEILAWGAVLGLTRSWAVVVFLLVGGGTMTVWATQKHRAYKREFGDKYPKGRKIIFPFIY
ncbi:hypothetical protein DACRYDRAFT_93078 [Dacryopinax primogenitus]|uniref:Ubiquitin-like domain-containing protein n=1 Tax=Dacryopinax primogenitus (strain DJM 731) TaxID=1858805 RepID=M5G2V0_DACPD|nr:uncharacterized protein DACRYDRAFT_93078 [Dacryopinax primogenitus]EJU04556.1 hypothetical protein DACRYDRAFT_93078 [Dacryopinax primogenitus]